MKQQLKILLFLLLCLAVPLSHARADERIPLWGATYYGMTLNEVFARVTGARSSTADEKPLLSADHGFQALATLDNIEIAGEHFKVWFMFSSGKLNQVTLSLVPKIAEASAPLPYDNLGALYSTYTMLLTMKYGSPIKKSWQEYPPNNVRSWNTQWVSGITNIDLTVEKIQLEISYGAQYADDLRKL